MSEAYGLCDRCGRTVPVEGARDGEGFELCDACVEALAERHRPAEVLARRDRKGGGRRWVEDAPRIALIGPWRDDGNRPVGFGVQDARSLLGDPG
jgi:hypothetical protein